MHHDEIQRAVTLQKERGSDLEVALDYAKRIEPFIDELLQALQEYPSS